MEVYAGAVKVLYILGRGRGGSTVLANVLGEMEGFFSAGEVRTLWDPVVARNNPCGCGLPIADCPIWSRVLTELGDVDVDQVVRWQREIVRESDVRGLLRPEKKPMSAAMSGYAEVTSRLYRTISDVTGCEVIVDSSKRPSYAAFLQRLEGVDPYFVHLVRDPRASAYSWQTRKHESVYGAEVRRRNAFDSTLRWMVLNIESELLLRHDPDDHHLRLRYEDFAASPRSCVSEIARMVGKGDAPLPFVDERTVELGPNHTIAGNPSRFRTGRMEIKDSGEWRIAQGPAAKLASTVVALPLLRRYGYRLR